MMEHNHKAPPVVQHGVICKEIKKLNVAQAFKTEPLKSQVKYYKRKDGTNKQCAKNEFHVIGKHLAGRSSLKILIKIM